MLVSRNQNSQMAQTPCSLSSRHQKQQMHASTLEEQLTRLATGQTTSYLAKRMTRTCSLELENRLKPLKQFR